jgi:Zn-finger nucleic acid-binding protein
MEKVHLGGDRSQLVLDHCARCGGVWFEKGEAQQLTRYSPSDLWKHIPPRETIPHPPCHGCGAPIDRDAERCAVCARRNEIACPVCDKTMERRQHAGLTLDVCSRCKGVWFDHAELKSVWSLSVAEFSRGRASRMTQSAGNAAAIGGDILLESLFWAPGLTINAGAAAVEGIGHVAGAIGSVSLDGAANAAMGAAEMVGGAAEGVFEMIMDLISSIFDG